MENQLLNIKINQDDINAAIANAAKARTELDKLKASNKELENQKKALMKADGDQSAAITKLNQQISKNNTEIKANSTIVRQNEKIVVDNTAAQNANKGSITQLREQLKLVSKQWADLSEEERENEEIGGKLAKQKTDLTEKLKAEEKATGDTRRNVGNYSEGVQEAIQSSGLFGRQLGQLRQAQAAYSSASKLATKSTKAFRLALISTGIGAIVVAVGALVAAFASTQEGIDKVTSITRPLTAVFEKLKGLAQDLATNVFGGLAKILRGDIREGLADLKNGFTGAIGGISGAIKEGVEAGKELDKLQKQIEQTEIDLTKRRAELNAEFERSKEISEDDSKTEEERRASAQKAIQSQNELLQINQEFLDLQIKKKKLELSLNDSDRQGKKELAELEAQKIQFEAEASAKRTSARNFLESLDKQIDASRLAAIKEREQAEQASNMASLDSLRQKFDTEESLQVEFEEKMADRAVANEQANRLRVKESFAQGLIDRQEYEEQLLELEENNLNTQLLLAEIAKDEALNNLELSEQERQRIIQESSDVILGIREKQADKEIDITKKKAKGETDIEKKKQMQKVQLEQMAFDVFREIAGRESVLGKALSASQASINTYEAATAALGMKPYTPANIALAALTVVQGLASVKKIVSTPTPSFAQGGFTGDGYGSPDSSGYKPAGIVHEGEYVIKKSMVDNPAFSGVINAIEMSRLKGYADGGFVSRSASLPATQGLESAQLQSTLSELRNMQPIVKVTDINRVSGQAQMVRVSGELS